MKILIILMITLLTSSIAKADIDAQLDQMCDKIKQCGLEQLGAAVPPEMEESMQGLFDGMCRSILSSYKKSYQEVIQAGLEDEANACNDSFLQASCSAIMESQGENFSPECQEFERAAEEAGIDIGK